MPEAPSWRGGIATNEVTMAKELVKLEAEIKALREMLTQISAWLSFNTNPNAEEISEMKKSIDQLLKNEG